MQCCVEENGVFRTGRNSLYVVTLKCCTLLYTYPLWTVHSKVFSNN